MSMSEADRLKLRLKDGQEEIKALKAAHREEGQEAAERWNRYKGAAALGAGSAVVGRHKVGRWTVGLDELVTVVGLVTEPKRAGIWKGATEAAYIRTIGNLAEQGASAAIDAAGLRERVESIRQKSLRAVND